jgi:hypothetical protein
MVLARDVLMLRFRKQNTRTESKKETARNKNEKSRFIMSIKKSSVRNILFPEEKR